MKKMRLFVNLNLLGQLKLGVKLYGNKICNNFSFEKRSQVTMKVYSRDFSNEYSKILNGMQERRMKASIKAVGSFWYTAWINAGQPELENLQSQKREPFLNRAKEEPLGGS